MWKRIKRLVNAYLDRLIERVGQPDRELREAARAEIVRLRELEARERARAKLIERELADLELELARRGAAADLVARRDALKEELSGALAQAERARSLREERRLLERELAAEIHLAAMREAAASEEQSSRAALEEMRARLGLSGEGVAGAEADEGKSPLDAGSGEKTLGRADESTRPID